MAGGGTLDLGTLFLGTAVDIAPFTRLGDTVKALSRQINRLASRGDEASDALVRAGLSQEVALTKALDRARALRQALREVGANGATIGAVTRATNKLADAIGGGIVPAEELKRALENFDVSVSRGQRRLKETIDTTAKLTRQRNQLITQAGTLATVEKRARDTGTNPAVVLDLVNAYKKLRKTLRSGTLTQTRFTNAVSEFKKEINKAKAAIAETEAENKRIAKMEQQLNKLAAAEQRVNAVRRQAGGLADTTASAAITSRTEAALERLRAEMQRGVLTTTEYNTAVRKFNESVDQSVGAVHAAKAAESQRSKDISQQERQLNKLADAEQRVASIRQQALALGDSVAVTKIVRSNAAALEDLRKAFSSGALSADDYNAALRRFNGRVTESTLTIKQLNTAEKAAKDVLDKRRRNAAQFERQLDSLAIAERQIIELQRQLGQFRDRSTARVIGNANLAALERFRAELTSGTLSTKQYNAALREFGDRLAEGTRKVRSMRDAQRAAKQEKFNKFMRDMQSASVLAVGPLSGLGARIAALGSIIGRSQLKMALFVGSITGITVGIIALGKAALKASQEMQKIDAAFTVATGSLVTGRVEFEFSKEVALKYGVALKDVAKAYAKFDAAARFTSLTQREIRGAFEGVITAGAALQLSTEDVSGALRALQQIASKGTVQAEELRGQFGERIPGAFQLAAGSMGLTTTALNKMLDLGEVTAEMFLKNIGPTLIKVFGPEAQKNVDRLTGQLGILNTRFFLFSTHLSNTVGLTRGATSALSDFNSIIEWLDNNINIVTGSIGAFGGLLAGLTFSAIIFNIKRIGTALTWLAGIFGLTTTAATGFVGVLGLLARAAIVGGSIGAGIRLMTDRVDEQKQVFDETIDSIKTFIRTSKVAGSADERLVTNLTKRLGDLRKEAEKGIIAVDMALDRVKEGASASVGFKEITTLRKQKEGLVDRLQIIKGLLNEISRIKIDPATTGASKAFDSLKRKITDVTDKALDLQAALTLSDNPAIVAQMTTFFGMARNIKRALKDTPSKKAELTKLLGDLASALGIVVPEGTEAARVFALIVEKSDSLKRIKSNLEPASKAIRDMGIAIEEMRARTAALRAGPSAVNAFEDEFGSRALAQNIKDARDQLFGAIDPANTKAADAADLLIAKYQEVVTALFEAERGNRALTKAQEAQTKASKRSETTLNKLLDIADDYAAAQTSAAESTEAAVRAISVNDFSKQIGTLTKTDLAKLIARLDELGIQGETTAERLQVLKDFLDSLRKTAKKAGKDVSGALADIDRETETLQRRAAAIARGPEFLSMFEARTEIEQSIRKLGDQLKDLGLSAEEFNKRVNDRRAALAAVKAAERAADRQKELQKEVEQFFDKSFDRIGDSITSAFAKGEDALISLKSVAKAVLSDIQQEILKLTVIDPLKNATSSFVGGLINGTSSSAGGSLSSVLTNSLGSLGKLFGLGGGISSAAAGGAASSVGVLATTGGLTNAGISTAAGLGLSASTLGLAGAGIAAAAAIGKIFKRKPSDKSQSFFFDLATAASQSGGQTGNKFSQENATARDQVLAFAQQVVDELNKAGATATGTLEVLIGSRDGLRFTFDRGAQQVAGSVDGLMNAIGQGIADRVTGATPEVLDALRNTDFADPNALANLEHTIQLPSLRADFLDKVAADMLALTDAAESQRQELRKQQQERLDEAKALGISADGMQQLNDLFAEQSRVLEESLIPALSDAAEAAKAAATARLRATEFAGIGASIPTDLEALSLSFVQDLPLEERIKRANTNLDVLLRDLGTTTDRFTADLDSVINNAEIPPDTLQQWFVANEKLKAIADLEAQRNDELERANNELRTEEIGLLGDLSDQLQNNARDLSNMISALSSVSDFVDSLATSDLSPLSPSDKFDAASQAFFNALNAAKAGDLEAIKNLPDVSREFIDQAKAFSPATQFPLVFDTVTSALDSFLASGASSSFLSEADQQTAELIDAITEAFGDQGSSIVSSLDGVKELLAEMSDDNETTSSSTIPSLKTMVDLLGDIRDELERSNSKLSASKRSRAAA